MSSEFDPNLSFLSGLCVGHIAESQIFPYPEIKPEEAETLKGVMEAVDSFLKGRQADFRKWDTAGELPQEILQQMREFGLFGLIVPESAGGLGLSTTGYSRTLQQLGRHDASIALTAGAHSSIGMKGLILYGTEAQKKKYLPKLATGEMIAAFCLTEAGAGSDAASITTKAEKQGDSWILSGEKIWITNGGIADFYTVFAVTNSEKGKITAFIVTRDMPGVSSGPHEDKMGIRASSTTTVSFNKVKLGPEHILGEEGKGFKVAMNILNSGRTGLGGGCVGGMKKLIELASEQAKLRKQFGKSISEFGLVKQKIGQMTVDCYVTESVVNMVSGFIDKGAHDYAAEAAISKVLASENLWNSVDAALQIAGGNGFMKEFPYERVMRDCRVNRIFEGANEILRMFIALTAMKTAATELSNISQMIQHPQTVFDDPIKGFGLLASYSKRFMTSSMGRGANKMTKVHPLLFEQQKVIETHTSSLTKLTDTLIKRHGKKIVSKQFACSRVAGVVIELFALSCVLSRVSSSIQKNGEAKAKAEIDIAKIAAHQSKERIENYLRQVDDNCDELIKQAADHTFAEGRYVWDNLFT